ncbi:MAG: hypothetical protein LBB86_07970 [Oscillospiraceae bacterium]|nr:hypothetical protein [Oscillospiraceae bacterium]
MPKAIGCGRIHRCADSWSDVGSPSQYLILCNNDSAHANLDGQLDGYRLPGRPPHTITCVHATGIHSRARNPLLAPIADCAASGSNIIINPTNGYDMVLRIEIPLEVIIRDCCGNQYCLKSFLIDEIRIPLCVRAQLVRDSSDYLFLKARVRLCTPYSVPATSSTNACTNQISIGPDTLRLEMLAEACVVKLVPYGVLGYDPYSCQPPKYN